MIEALAILRDEGYGDVQMYTEGGVIEVMPPQLRPAYINKIMEEWQVDV